MLDSQADRPRHLKILFVCFPYSVHAARWTRLLEGKGHDIHVFPSQANHHLHEEFRDITFWPVPGLGFDVGDRHIRTGTLAGMPASDMEASLAALITYGQFDIVHSLEFQHAGYLTLGALARVQVRRPVWIATNYGSDISLLAAQPQHSARIREILSQCDYYSAECHRDVALARQLGLRKPVFLVCPNSGGIDINLASRLRSPEPTSARRVIAVKGYQHFAGRALTALKAIDLVRDELRNYCVCVFSAFPEVREEAERLRSQRAINIQCLSEQVPHEDILRLHGRARVSIAVSVGDGISTALLEAMAMGSFPIQTCTACADEWIVNGESGFIVHPDNLEQIANRLKVAVTDDELVNTAATINLQKIVGSASREAVAAQVNSAYARIPLPNIELPSQSSKQQTGVILTVITPTYNRAEHLKETIESVLSQGFVDLQYIIMDDGSTDETEELIKNYGKRVEYHWHENVGEQRTVNRALALVQGEFFMIVNSDDPVLPNCLGRMVRALIDNPFALAAYPNWQVIDSDSNSISEIQVDDFNFTRMLESTSVSIGPGACFRRSVLDRVGYRNPLLRYSADLDYWFRITLTGTIVHVDQTLATHRTHPGSAIVASRGNLMAREVAYLFEAYSRHPQAHRHITAAADANGHFLAAFACTNLRSATRELLRSVLANPVTFLNSLERHGGIATIEFLEHLEDGARKNATETNATETFETLMAATCRSVAFRVLARGALHDPSAWLRAAMEFGLPQLVSWVRQLPVGLSARGPRSPREVSRYEMLAFILRRIWLVKRPFKRNERKEFRGSRLDH